MNEPLLQVSQLRKTFSQSSKALEVLCGLDLTLAPGERIAIIGKSGAGKSTLLHILGTLESPTDGKILYQGKDLRGYSEKELARFRNEQIGFVFQFHYLMLEFTALENVMVPALLGGVGKSEAKNRATELLERVGLKERSRHRPPALSGGEQQRVAIARALMRNPTLLLTDEMTGNLDPITGAQVFSLVESMHREFKMAMISVTHDESLASAFPKVFSLQNGQLMRIHPQRVPPPS